MPLPGSRDFNAADGGPLPAATVNNLQDAIVGLQHGAITRMAEIPGFRSLGVTLDGAQNYFEFVGVAVTDRVKFILPLRPGDRLLEWAVFGRDDAAPVDRLLAEVFSFNPLSGFAGTAIGNQIISAGTGADQKFGEVLSVPHVVAADRAIGGQIRPDPAGALDAGNTMRIYPVVLYRYDHP